MGTGFCPNGGGTDGTSPAILAEQVGILSPIMHEIMARTGQKFANPGLITLDVAGNVATNGEYLFPFGMNLGGIATPEMDEIDLNAMATPISFSGIPWNLDRRLSPGGCIDTDNDGDVDCEATPQPLVPFPYEAIDPRTQANLPTGTYNDPNFTSSALTDARNRVMSFVNGSLGKFNGDSTLLAWPPVDPAFININPVPSLPAIGPIASPPVVATGWNLLGWNQALPTTAETFGQSITGTDVISKFDNVTQQWVTHIMNFPLNDFTITSGDGFFIHKP
jgi:hypothetical protein